MENNEQLECSCLTADNCNRHNLTPKKRFEIMDKAIEKVHKLANGEDSTPFTSEEYMLNYTCAFFFSSIRFYGTLTEVLYERFLGAFQDNILAEILPSLNGKENAQLLMEIVDKWAKYKILAHWLVRFLEPLRQFCSTTRGTNISDVPFQLFCDWVFDPMWTRIRGAVMRLINQERTGMEVDRDLIKAAIELLGEVDDKGLRSYYRNFELALQSDINARYNNLAQAWISDCSFDEYIRQALDCIGMEERRMEYYLALNTVSNVKKGMMYELMDKRARTVVQLLFRGGHRRP